MTSKSATLGAMGAASLLAGSAVAAQAFVAPSSSSSTALRGAPAAQAHSASQGSAGQAAAATAVATAAVVLVSSRRAARSKAATARCAEATGVTDEKPFAGGLIGGESAFAGQDFNFDPLGLSVKCEKYLPWFREAELKHGRTAAKLDVALLFLCTSVGRLLMLTIAP